MKSPSWTPHDLLLKGTAARILFGDPSLIVCDGFTAPPFTTTLTEEADTLRIKSTLSNTALKSTLTDTYHNDLNPMAPFNDRALVVVDPKEVSRRRRLSQVLTETRTVGKMPMSWGLV